MFQIRTKKKIHKDKSKSGYKTISKVYNGRKISICINSSCHLRKAGCLGFEGCPGYMAR